jgi:hypothetical protein
VFGWGKPGPLKKDMDQPIPPEKKDAQTWIRTTEGFKGQCPLLFPLKQAKKGFSELIPTTVTAKQRLPPLCNH